MGALSSGLFLFGRALLCGAGGSVYFYYLELLFNFKQSFSDICVLFGYLLIIAALFFKLSGAPFHIWFPDVYEGAPTKTVVLLAIVPKTGIFFSFIFHWIAHKYFLNWSRFFSFCWGFRCFKPNKSQTTFGL